MQSCAIGRAVIPVAQSPEGNWALHLQLAQGVAAEAVPQLVLDLVEGVLHQVQRVVLPPGRACTTVPRKASSPRWPPFGARAPPGPSRVGGGLIPRWPW